MALLDSRAALDAEDEELNRCEVWSVSQVNVRTSGRCNSASLRCHIRRPRRLQGGMLWPWMARAQNCKDSAQALILAGADASLKDAEQRTALVEPACGPVGCAELCGGPQPQNTTVPSLFNLKNHCPVQASKASLHAHRCARTSQCSPFQFHFAGGSVMSELGWGMRLVTAVTWQDYLPQHIKKDPDLLKSGGPSADSAHVALSTALLRNCRPERLEGCSSKRAPLRCLSGLSDPDTGPCEARGMSKTDAPVDYILSRVSNVQERPRAGVGAVRIF